MNDKKRILMVDDEVAFTALTKLNLERTGRYEVRAEREGAVAVQAAREFKPHLVLLDVVMPDVDGGQVLAEMRADAELQSIPVAFLTATVTKQATEERPEGIGGMPVIAKPVEPKQLMRQIESILAQSPI